MSTDRSGVDWEFKPRSVDPEFYRPNTVLKKSKHM